MENYLLDFLREVMPLLPPYWNLLSFLPSILFHLFSLIFSCVRGTKQRKSNSQLYIPLDNLFPLKVFFFFNPTKPCLSVWFKHMLHFLLWIIYLWFWITPLLLNKFLISEFVMSLLNIYVTMLILDKLCTSSNKKLLLIELHVCLG